MKPCRLFLRSDLIGNKKHRLIAPVSHSLVVFAIKRRKRAHRAEPYSHGGKSAVSYIKRKIARGFQCFHGMLSRKFTQENALRVFAVHSKKRAARFHFFGFYTIGNIRQKCPAPLGKKKRYFVIFAVERLGICEKRALRTRCCHRYSRYQNLHPPLPFRFFAI